MENYLIPSLENIKALYEEIITLLSQLKTKQDVVEFGKKHTVTMEINYDLAENFDEKEEIEVIRCECWGDLDYIYYYTGKPKPTFDVWCDFMDSDFVDSAWIDNIEEYYIKGIKWLYNRTDEKDELIKAMRDIGTEYNELIEVYGFDVDVVEKYENEHYTWGEGDNNVKGEKHMEMKRAFKVKVVKEYYVEVEAVVGKGDSELEITEFAKTVPQEFNIDEHISKAEIVDISEPYECE